MAVGQLRRQRGHLTTGLLPGQGAILAYRVKACTMEEQALRGLVATQEDHEHNTVADEAVDKAVEGHPSSASTLPF